MAVVVVMMVCVSSHSLKTMTFLKLIYFLKGMHAHSSHLLSHSPEWLQQPDLSQSKAGRQQFQPDLQVFTRGPLPSPMHQQETESEMAASGT